MAQAMFTTRMSLTGLCVLTCRFHGFVALNQKINRTSHPISSIFSWKYPPPPSDSSPSHFLFKKIAQGGASLILGEFLHALQQKTLHLKLHISVLQKVGSWLEVGIPFTSPTSKILKTDAAFKIHWNYSFSQNHLLLEKSPQMKGELMLEIDTPTFLWTMIVGERVHHSFQVPPGKLRMFFWNL